VCQWLFEAVAGLRPDPEQPGFRHILFEPTIIPALSPVAGHHDSPAGRIEAGWSLDGGKVTYTVAIPDGASGTLILDPEWRDTTIDGAAARGEDGRFQLGPGRHIIDFTM
jgi:alpha-L-rhamnosidase